MRRDRERRYQHPLPADGWLYPGRQRMQQRAEFRRGRVAAQVWLVQSTDGLKSHAFSLSRWHDSPKGDVTSRELDFADLRDCRKALRDVKKWWRDERKRTRRPLWQRIRDLF
jgi:hypothetical protein